MKEIMIIGAGAAGLIAAESLAQRGHKVRLVEARNRTGGRIFSFQSGFSHPVEGGAEFVHGQQPVTDALLRKAGIERTLLEGNRYSVFEGLMERGDIFDEQWQALTDALGKLSGDMDMARFMDTHFSGDQYSALRKKVRGFVEGYDAADLTRVSALALREEWSESDDEHQYRVAGGYHTLINYLEDRNRSLGCEILLQRDVIRIEWSRGQVNAVTSTGETLRGDAAIVTVPLGVLQSGAIEFSPPIPEHERAIRSMGFGGVIKFFLEFKSPVWETRGSRPLRNLAFVFSDAAVPTWWTQRPDKTLLTGWLGGPKTLGLPASGDELMDRALKSLEYILKCSRNEILDEMRHSDVINWVLDPFARGAYAYPTTDTDDALKLLEKPVQQTLWFAGEALYRGTAIGTVEAALHNGRAVGERFKI